MTGGILAGLPEYLAERGRREYAAERLALMYNCTIAQAHAWLNHDDEQAVELATKRLEGKPICIDGETISIDDGSYS
jgi:hypothetical protein